jgi:hypothetical protein
LTRAGAKLLDFGLAKSSPVATSASLSMLPTTPAAARTAVGTILGTFQYMAPEQLEGREADARTDIFAFGTVIYEMLTGKKAFEGRSQATLIAAIIGSNPTPMSELQPLTPAGLEQIVLSALAKDPDDRWQSARDLLSQLKWIAESGARVGAPVAAPPARRSRIAPVWIVSGLLAAVLAGVTTATLWQLTRATPQAGIVRLMIVPPENQHVVGAPIISPDGGRIAFVATTPEGTSRLWLRPIDAMAPQPLQATEDATYPFWSPDSRFIAFFASGQLKKIDVSGGSPQTICEATNGRGGAWNRAGVIIFSQRISSGLVQVSSAGGSPTPPREQVDRPRDRWRQRGVVRRGASRVRPQEHAVRAAVRPRADVAGRGRTHANRRAGERRAEHRRTLVLAVGDGCVDVRRRGAVGNWPVRLDGSGRQNARHTRAAGARGVPFTLAGRQPCGDRSHSKRRLGYLAG